MGFPYFNGLLRQVRARESAITPDSRGLATDASYLAAAAAARSPASAHAPGRRGDDRVMQHTLALILRALPLLLALACIACETPGAEPDHARTGGETGASERTEAREQAPAADASRSSVDRAASPSSKCRERRCVEP